MASTSKTRDKMVEVARELFAKRGIQATTMNDIADAAGKGRRTLYTYFRSKEDIYQAVVKCELTQFLHDMEIAKRINLPPEQKLINLIYVHLESVKNIVLRNGLYVLNSLRIFGSWRKLELIWIGRNKNLFRKSLTKVSIRAYLKFLIPPPCLT